MDILTDADNQDALPFLRYSIIQSVYKEHLGQIPNGFIHVEHRLKGLAVIMGEQASDVLCKEHFWLELLDDARKIIEHRAAHISEAKTFSGIAEGLAGIAAGDKMDMLHGGRKERTDALFRDFDDVLLDDVPTRAILAESRCGILVALDERFHLETRLLQAECEPAGAGEQLDSRNMGMVLRQQNTPLS